MITYPIDWNEVVLGDIAPLRGGFAFSSDRYSKLGIPIVRITNILSNGSVGGDFVYYSESVDDGSYILPDKSLVVAMSGATTGKVATLYCRNGDKYYQNQRVGYFQEIKGNDYTFISHLVKSSLFSKQIKDVLVAGAQPNVSPKDINSFKFSIPQQIKEQQAIASALSDFDEHIDNLTQLISKKKAIREGALDDLVSGRTRVDGFDGEWEEKQLKELCYLITKQTGFDYSAEIKPSLVLNKQDGVLPFIQNKDFEKCFINYSTDFYIPGNIAEKYPKILLDEVCLLISISGRIGNVGVFNNEYTAFAGGAVGIAKLFNPSLAEWCMYFLISEQGQKQIFKHEKVGAQHNLTVADVRNLKVQIPPAKEREGIVSVLKSMDEEIESLKIEKDKMIQIKEGAMDDLLTGRVRLKV